MSSRLPPFFINCVATALFVLAGDTTADPQPPPSGYQCAPGETNKGVGCTCPTTHVEKRDAENTATCVSRPPKPKAATITPSTEGCLTGMMHVPASSFLMGAPAGARETDNLQHRVTLGGYCIDKTEVTVAAYSLCVGVKACTAAFDPPKSFGYSNAWCNGTRADRQDHPVNCVDWAQAKAYCAWAKKRLPTEAEWEHAARGDDRLYPWGNTPPTETLLNACAGECPSPKGKKSITAKDAWVWTAPVGSFPGGASPFGLLDMAGNVGELVGDLYGPYATSALTNPTGAKSGDSMVTRGGGWNTEAAAELRMTYRGYGLPVHQLPQIGFRCAVGD